MKYVTGFASNDEINKALAVPVKITTDDGRELVITNWSGDISIDSVATVTITARVLVKE